MSPSALLPLIRAPISGTVDESTAPIIPRQSAHRRAILALVAVRISASQHLRSALTRLHRSRTSRGSSLAKRWSMNAFSRVRNSLSTPSVEYLTDRESCFKFSRSLPS